MDGTLKCRCAQRGRAFGSWSCRSIIGLGRAASRRSPAISQAPCEPRGGSQRPSFALPYSSVSQPLGDQSQNAGTEVVSTSPFQMAGDQGIAAKASAGVLNEEHQLDDDEKEVCPRPFVAEMIKAKPQVDRH